MRKLLFLCSMALFSTAAFAQQPASTPVSHQKAAAAVYVCPKCFATSSTPGKCNMDGTAMIKMGDYFCPKCGMDEGTKAGKCSMDGTTLVRMTPAYTKAHSSRAM